MNGQYSDNILDGLVRYGQVTALQGTKARVFFADINLTSDWLPCLQHKKAKVTVEEGGEDDAAHGHEAELDEWKPEVGDMVVVLYLPVQSADGFVLGVVEQ